VSGKGDAFNSPGQASDIATEVVTNLAQWRLSVDPDQGTVYSVLWYSAESSLEEMEVLTPLRGECSQMHQGWFADPMCSTKRRSTLSDRT
jgi:hypothetical protein